MPNPQPDRQHHRTSTGLPPSVEAIGQYDACIPTDRTKRFGMRLPNQGFTRHRLACVSGGLPLILYAATGSVRSLIAPVPASRIAVIQDMDFGRRWAFSVGDVYTAIVITDGPVRDILGARAWEFPLFACLAGVSHSYIHIVDSADPAETLALRIRAGDLLYAARYVRLFHPCGINRETSCRRAEDWPTPTANRRDRPVTRFLARETRSRHSPNRWRSPC